MPLALWTLMWLTVRAAFRRVGRQAKSVRGVALTVLGLFVVCVRVLPAIYVNGHSPQSDPAGVRAAAPVAILGFCLMNLLTSAGERAVTFSAAEVDFLFPGPFTRRQLLTYKLVKTGLGSVLSAMLFGLILSRYGGPYWGHVIGIWLTFQFMQMLAMVFALVQTTLGERLFAAGRWLLFLTLLAVVVAVVAPRMWENRNASASTLASELRGSTPGRCVLAPFTVYGNAITAERFFPDALRWDAIGLAIDLSLVGLVMVLDANYLETATNASAKRYARVSRIRRVGLAGTANAGSARFRIPPLPWLGGAGPVAWRQLTGVIRTGRGLLVVVAIVAIAGGGTVAHADRDPQSLLSLVVVSIGINLFLSTLLKFDFRGDLDHLDVLRALPLRPSAVAVGEVIAPTVVLSCVQGLLLIAAAVWGHVPLVWLATAAAFVIPINAILVATENLLFLLFPSQQSSAVAGDMGMVGRQSIVLMCRLLVLLMVGAVAFGIGLGTYMVAGHSMPIAVVATWIPLAVTIVAVLALLALVYDRFDPSVDTPT